MTTPTKKKPAKPKKLNLRPMAPTGGAAGSGGMGPYFGGARNSPAINPGVREQ